MKVNFVGDIGVFKRYEELNIDPFLKVKLPESDLNIGNFEFAVPRIKNKFFYDVQDNYVCSFKYLEKLKIDKFHGFGFANNHCMDYGKEGVMNTIELAKKSGIEVFGFSHDTNYTIGEFRHDGISLGIIACVKRGRFSKEIHGYGPDDYDVDKICALIKKEISNYDHIVIFPHWGTELVEIPERQDTINAKRFIDSGASAVIGHHPHVSQGIEFYNNGIIAYSLGSFIYLPGEELGYSSIEKNRNISICLNIEFSKRRIQSYESFFYGFSEVEKIPIILANQESSGYARYLNEIIYNHKLFKKQFYGILLRRELKSFWKRFKINPLVTILNYIKLFKPKRIMRILSK